MPCFACTLASLYLVSVVLALLYIPLHFLENVFHTLYNIYIYIYIRSSNNVWEGWGEDCSGGVVYKV